MRFFLSVSLTEGISVLVSVVNHLGTEDGM
jgi:hypothetical protein